MYSSYMSNTAMAAPVENAWEMTLNKLEESSPEFIFRRDLARYTGGLLNPRTEANRDSAAKRDPSIPCILGRCTINNRVAYPSASVFTYLRSRMSPAPTPQVPQRGFPEDRASKDRLTGEALVDAALALERSAPGRFPPEKQPPIGIGNTAQHGTLSSFL